MKRSLSFYTVFFIGCMLVMRLTGVLSKIVLARVITPYEYGIITLIIISLPDMFRYFTNFCLHDLLSHSTKGMKYFGFSVLYGIYTSILIGILVFIFHDHIFGFLGLPLDNWHILFIGFFIVLISNAMLVDMTGILRGLRRYSLTSILASLPPIVKLILILIAVYVFNTTDFNTILLVFALSPLLVLIGVLIKEWGRLYPLFTSIHVPSKDVLLFGISVFVVSLFGSVSQILTKIVVSHDLGIEYQGYFDVSLTLVGIIGFAFGAMQFISLPEATNSKNREDLLSRTGGLGDVSKALFSFLFFCIILLYFYSHQFVDLLFSRDYIIAADHILILAIGYVFLFIQQFLAYVNISFSKDTREYNKLILITLILLGISPFVTHLLIQVHGFIGAYISVTSFLILYSIISLLFFKDLSPLTTLLYKIERLFVTILITSLFLFYFKPSLLVGVIVCSVIYFTLVFLLGYLKKELVFNLFSSRDYE